ncbi:MAG: 3-methyl-2-oxobutanoate hydroxymethyltransferase [Armatimonadota bacterium]
MKRLIKLCVAAMSGHRIVMLTAYDALFAGYAATSDVDILLVGDSLGMVIQGHTDTLPVTINDIAYHTASVARGNTNAVILADLPFGTYQASVEDAMRAAATLMQAGAHAVKLEGGIAMAETFEFLVKRGVPVVGHIGMTPQSVHLLGGFRVQGRTDTAVAQLETDLSAITAAGASMVVLECVPAAVGTLLSSQSSVPVIGIGAGPDTHGQVMVLHDILGWTSASPKFARNFEPGATSVQDAISSYVAAVREATFPNESACYV